MSRTLATSVPLADPPPLLGEADYAKFVDFFYRKTGIRFGDTKRAFVEKRIADRMRVVEAAGFRDYFVKLRFEHASGELQELTHLLTINET